MRYKDAAVAIEFLCNAFGFSRHFVHEEKNGTIPHAQLLFKNSMIMVSSEKDNEYGKLVASPISLGGVNTMSPYLILTDEEIDSHYENAKAAGAEIVYKLKAEEYGGKAYSCKDPEGYLWNFGSYTPWQ
jgi:uncharacterized glyoxalase superfamily protein PhnB